MNTKKVTLIIALLTGGLGLTLSGCGTAATATITPTATVPPTITIAPTSASAPQKAIAPTATLMITER